MWISNHQTLQFSPLCLVCLGFLRAECHRRVNYVHVFSPLYFSPPPPFSPDVCAREPMHVHVCVLANEPVQALFFFWTSLWCCCLFIYFPACKGPFSAVRATADWAHIAFECHPSARRLSDGWTTDPDPLHHSSSKLQRRRGIFVFWGVVVVTRRALFFINNLSGWASMCATCKTLLLWFLTCNKAIFFSSCFESCVL